MSAPVERMIRAAAKKKIRGRELFTSVDIANDIKTSGVWVRNRNVAERLRQCVMRWAEEENTSYTQQMITVDAGSRMTSANVYLPTNKTVSSMYLKRDQKAITPSEFEDMHKTSVMPWNKRD